MQGEKGVDESIPVLRVVLVLVYQPAHEGSALDEHVLAGCGRAELVGLPPVGSGLLVSLLLVVLLVVGEILDAFCAVRTPFSLGEHIRTADHHSGERYNY